VNAEGYATIRELGNAHEFAISLLDPRGEPVAAIRPVNSPPAEHVEPLQDGERRWLNLALNFTALVFSYAGAHSLDLSVDGELMRSETFAVVVAR
jgi:hypothetical protein